MSNAPQGTTLSGAELKEAMGYLYSLAIQGKLSVSPAEADVILQNLKNIKALIEGIADNTTLFTPPDVSLDDVAEVPAIPTEVSTNE